MTSKRVLLLFCPGTEILEAAAFYDALGWSGAYRSVPVEVVTAAPESVVACTFGMRVQVDCLLGEVNAEEFDALAIPGGFETFGFYDAAYSAPVQALITQFVNARKPIATICVGALPLAKTGALRERQATTYNLRNGQRRQQLAELGACVVDRPIVRDGVFITSTSPATALEVAFQLLGVLTGEANAQAVRELMGFAVVPV